MLFLIIRKQQHRLFQYNIQYYELQQQNYDFESSEF